LLHWEVVYELFGLKRFAHALFFAHLVLEKLLKAHYVKDNIENAPPKIHDLIRLASRTKLEPKNDQLDFMDEMKDFQMSGRYPDELFDIYKKCTFEYSTNVLEKAKELREWLLKML
jgi:HEPN domain-containing protein